MAKKSSKKYLSEIKKEITAAKKDLAKAQLRLKKAEELNKNISPRAFLW